LIPGSLALLITRSHGAFCLVLSFTLRNPKKDWNIMSNSAMTQLAAQVPTSMEELSDLGILGENVVNDYGERLVRNISSFVQQNNLEKYLERRAAKRPKVAGVTRSTTSVGAAASSTSSSGAATTSGLATKGIGKENEDFDAGIDFAAIDLPTSTGNSGAPGTASTAASGAKKAGKKSTGGGTKSSYF
jgi:hypothetical protein